MLEAAAIRQLRLLDARSLAVQTVAGVSSPLRSRHLATRPLGVRSL